MKEGALTDLERDKLREVNDELLSYGFRFEMRDPVYTEYLKARFSKAQTLRHPSDKQADAATELARAKLLVEEALRATENKRD